MSKQTPAYFTPGFIDEVKNRSSIVDVIGESVHLKKTGKNYTACCPFHDDKNPSFSVSEEKQNFTCFSGCEGSGGSGDVFKFVMLNQSLSFIEAVEYLAKRANIPLPVKEDRKKTEAQSAKHTTLKDLFSLFEQNKKSFSDQFKSVIAQLHLSESALKVGGYKVGFTGNGATELEKAFEHASNESIANGKLLGLLNAQGKPSFPDNSLSIYHESDSYFQNAIFIGSNGISFPLVVNSVERFSQVFGDEQIKKNAIINEGQKRSILGDAIIVVETPLRCLQLLSGNVWNVVSPYNPLSFGLQSFNDQLRRLIRVTDHACIYFAFTPMSEQFEREKAKLIANYVDLPIPVVSIHKPDNLPLMIDFYKEMNTIRNSELVYEKNQEKLKSIKFITPAKYIGTTVINKLLKELGIRDSKDYFGSRRSELLKSFISSTKPLFSEDDAKASVVRCLTTVGFSELDYVDVIHPGLRDLAIKRAYFVSALIGFTAIDKNIAQFISGDMQYKEEEVEHAEGVYAQVKISDSVTLPDIFSPTEKMTLSCLSQNTLDRFSQGISDYAAYIKGYALDFHPNDDEDTKKLAQSIVLALAYCKEKRVSPKVAAHDVLKELTRMSESLTFDKDSLIFCSLTPDDLNLTLTVANKSTLTNNEPIVTP